MTVIDATTTTSATPLDERLVEAATGALELFGIHLGARLGLYDVLRDRDRTAGELAQAAGIAPRYAREWLEQQAVAGVLLVDDVSAPAEARRYTLPEAHVGVLADVVAPDHVAPLAQMVVGIATALDLVVEAYRTGGGVPFARYGPHLREGQGGINRPAFTSALVAEWLPALDSAVERLATGGRLLDVGCGQGWSTIAVSRAFPNADVWGIDEDAASIDDARAAAEEHGVSAQFARTDASRLPADAPFDVALMLEALHDLARPVEALAAVRGVLGADGVLLVADEAVAESFTAPGDAMERMMYGWSITHCLPAAMTDPHSAATGTVLREGMLRELAGQAGFRSVETLPLDGGFFRLYALRP